MKKIDDFLKNKVLVVVKNVFMTSGRIFSRKNLEKSQSAQEVVCDTLEQFGVEYELLARTDFKQQVNDRLVISIGGDGTLLDISHYCTNCIMLGVNSNPKISIGALCIADEKSFPLLMADILKNNISIDELTRLDVRVNKKQSFVLVMNEILFCHQNPASMSRYKISINDKEETHRSSGLYVSTGCGSTGAIYSAFGDFFSFSEKKAQFLVREFYWSDKAKPQLIHGYISDKQTLTIKNEIDDCVIYADGSHANILLKKDDEIQIKVSDNSLWMINGDTLLQKRKKILSQRNLARKFFNLNEETKACSTL